MLIRYKKSFKKIAMGLLSYMPQEKELRTLRETIECYENNDERQLYLWKIEEDIVGVVGVAIGVKNVEILHIAVNPSYRDEGIGTEMIAEVTKAYPDKDVVPGAETTPFYEKCTKEAGKGCRL
ncbi:GNAT family N-acetyltransferase [Domibacillus epiphyticus]|uniref:N-acetyltransferase n=1 Tax=Domibacillus epiphyticus TaxID=1714355 RepID=A0A1V2A4H5_9BACI|nr:GNAT family N-acetyltransferase [Domibacillus epiphyticus]OMP65899.1 N-acetyltransferase [Domibacillus epiphyticus]